MFPILFQMLFFIVLHQTCTNSEMSFWLALSFIHMSYRDFSPSSQFPVVKACLTPMVRVFTAGEEWSDGGRVHIQEETSRDHNALLRLTQHAAVQEEDRAVGAAAGIHAGAGAHAALQHQLSASYFIQNTS